MAYALAPWDPPTQLSVAGRLAIWLVVVVLAVLWQIRAVMHSPHPWLRAVQGAALGVTLLILPFATAYASISAADPATFTQPMTRLDAFYFTVTVFATVGFGDIAPVSEPARLLVTVQMLADLVLIGMIVKVLVGAAQRRRESLGPRVRPGRDPVTGAAVTGCGAVTGRLAAVLVVLVAANVWVHVGPGRAQLLTQPAAAVLLLVLGRWAGLSWADLGVGVPAARVGLLVGLVGAYSSRPGTRSRCAVPRVHGAFLDTRYDVGLRRPGSPPLVAIPLSTVVLEESAFRGVIWGPDRGRRRARDRHGRLVGAVRALARPARPRPRPDEHGDRDRRLSVRRTVTVVASTVAGTAFAGLLLAELRLRTGSLLAPIAVHWAANGIGVVASAWVWRRRAARPVKRPEGSPARDEVVPRGHEDSEGVPRQGRES